MCDKKQCNKKESINGRCPYCKMNSFYICRENDEDRILCLNCGQIFAADDIEPLSVPGDQDAGMSE